jgi:quercetin dioxygenase-like cupin family protein
MTQLHYPAGSIAALPNRPGMRGRNLMAAEHGVTTLFVAELFMDHGSSIPLHTHPTEEVFFVNEGSLVMQVGDETVVAEAESVVRIPAGAPHAVHNDKAATAHALTAGAWNRATWFTAGTTYLEGVPREGSTG